MTDAPIHCRLLIQQCTRASLKSDDKEFEIVEIKKGMVVYVCFLKDATGKTVESAVKTILNAKLVEKDTYSEDETYKDTRKKILEIEEKCDILLVPQATLGGKLKGSSVQYHCNIDKTQGSTLFSQLAQSLSKDYELNQSRKDDSLKGIVFSGKYGARQILAMETNGPFSHLFDVY